MIDYEDCINEILIEILMYLSNLSTAKDGLDALATDIRLCFDVDGEVLAPAALALGQVVLTQFKEIGIYTNDGILPYTFERQWQDYSTPIFVKITESS